MSRIFALADLHLSHSGSKPMDIFGAQWVGHAERMATHWDTTVSAGDVVLLPGDLSWARSLEEAAADLEWISRRPGRKLLLRGNHDSWWGSAARTRAALPADCQPLHNNALEAGNWVVVGARGWLAPDDPIAGERDAVIFRRELERLKLSIQDADRRFDPSRPRLAMLHYPPWLAGRRPTEVVTILEQARVQVAVYGHLHGEDHRMAIQGRHAAIDYRLVASDAVGFCPVDLELDSPADSRP